VTGYSLVGAAVIVTSGALGDVFGRRLMFLLGIALFVASCVLIALSSTGAGVIIGRCIQGASGPVRNKPGPLHSGVLLLPWALRSGRWWVACSSN
jgi:MFS family permease